MGVPEVLLSGDHGEIARWRKERAWERTRERRPDLIAGAEERSKNKKDEGED
jgi:tRNA (guanine37-N1)-methyltransferase